MQKKLYLCFLSALLALSSCGKEKETSFAADENSSTPAKTSTIDVELPTEIPVLEEDSIQIHYQRKDKKYAPWSLWLWAQNADGDRYEFNYMDDDYVIASYALSTFSIDLENNPSDKLGFIVAKNPGSTWDAKDVDDDRFIDFSSLTKDDNDVYHVYIYQGDKNVYVDSDKTIVNKIESCAFKDENSITVTTSNAMSKIEIYANGEKIAEQSVPGTKTVTYAFSEANPFSYSNAYTIKVTFKDGDVKEQPVSMQKLYATSSFNEAFTYSGELGAIYTNSSTTFRVWSPVSSKMVLKIYDNGTPTRISNTLGSDIVYKEIEMEKKEKGVFETIVPEDLDGKYYTYTAYNGSYPNGAEVVDPYAKSTGINGLRGMVVNFAKTNPTNWDSIEPIQYDKKQLMVWETHVADVTSSATWTGTEENRKHYLGLVEEGTTYSKDGTTVKTGFDHIKELGVNAVQLIPIFDQANDEINPSFNWGYNPLNYNSLEGVYSNNPHDGYEKIKEFKQVVSKFNEAGINIIMDVVYNHTNSVNGTNFDVLMPGYYYRYTYNGSLYNGSGCGNETASELPMVRKFMIDSTAFWAKEYKLGGFRFDLMGLHDIETMNLLTANLKTINPAICVYGEPWTGGTSGLASSSQAIQSNANSFEGYGAFNDRLRDELVKGGLAAASERSWISNTSSNPANLNNLVAGIKGITKNASWEMKDPDKTVNYATCHDNYTLYDRFAAAGITNSDDIKKMAMLANSIVFTSQGITFMLAGEEFLRTKQGNNNSYNASYKINELNYELKIKNHDMFENYQKLIALKQNVDGLHLDKEENINLNVSVLDGNSVIRYTIQDIENNVEYIIIHSNGVNPTSRTEIDLSGYTLYLDTLGQLEETLGVVKPAAFQTIIAYK